MKKKHPDETKEDIVLRLHKNNTLCAKHFEPCMFTKGGKRLVQTAVPTIFNITNCPKTASNKRPPPKQRPGPEPTAKRRKIEDGTHQETKTAQKGERNYGLFYRNDKILM